LVVSVYWIGISLCLAATWSCLRDVFAKSANVRFQVARPVLDLAILVFGLGGLFHAGLSARRAGAEAASMATTTKAPSTEPTKSDTAPAVTASTATPAGDSSLAGNSAAGGVSAGTQGQTSAWLGQSDQTRKESNPHREFTFKPRIAVRSCASNACGLVGFVAAGDYVVTQSKSVWPGGSSWISIQWTDATCLWTTTPCTPTLRSGWINQTDAQQ
jgi:hypothetical protein